MYHYKFGRFIFYYGWKARYEISFYGNPFPLLINLDADEEPDGTTQEQKLAMDDFCENQSQLLKSAEELLNEYADFTDSASRFTPTTLYFKRDGSYALLCEDTENPEIGVAVLFQPDLRILSQDEYL